MIVQRFTVRIKPGKLDEALTIAKEARRTIWPFFPCRIYSSIYGPSDMVTFEMEAKNHAELEKLWEQVVANEEWGLYIARWRELQVEGGRTTELWNLEES